MDRRSQNRALRVRLAAAYRALDDYGLNEGINNHLTAIAPSAESEGDVMLLIPFGLLWSEVTPSCLLGLNEKNEVVEGKGIPDKSAMCIHRGIYNKRPDVKSVMHTHMPYTTALSCLEDPRIQMLHQNSTRFYNRVAYDDSYNGVSDTFEEGHRIAEQMGNNNVLLMSNHGVLTAAKSIDIAFEDMYFLEKAVMIEVLARGMHCPLKRMRQDVIEKTNRLLMKQQDKSSRLFMDAVVERLSKTCPDF